MKPIMKLFTYALFMLTLSFALVSCSGGGGKSSPDTPPTTDLVISGFTPLLGYSGQAVVITGSNFNQIAYLNTIKIGGISTTGSSVTSTSLTFRIPFGAAAGTSKIAVTSNGLTATSTGDFTVTAAPADAPNITSFDPMHGTVGTTVTIYGSSFSATASNNIVDFNGTSAIVSSSTTSSISTTVPVGAATGNITVQVGSYYCDSGAVGTFKVDVLPTITSVYYYSSLDTSSKVLDAGILNSEITIEGKGFSTDVANNIVSFTNTSGSISVGTVKTAMETKLTVTVPSDAATGANSITVKNNDSGLTSSSYSITVKQTGINITKSGGWLESAYLEWTPLSIADSYNVYYQKSGDSTWTKIDAQLIRNYSGYVRADVLGLAAGSYTLRVYASYGSVELSSSSDAAVTVLAHDRTGFAFISATTPGAYNSDGTLKPSAYVIYLTNNNKDSVTMNVYTSSTKTTACTGIVNILLSYKKGYDTRPLDIRMIGNVTDATDSGNDMDGDIVIENNNKANCVTFEGVGNDAVANGWGIRIKTANYIEIRNIGFMNCNSTAGDDVGLQQDNNYVWVHNCDMFYGNAGSDADQVKGDGALDTKGSNYCTYSYNHFWGNGKCNLNGLSENVISTASGAFYVTYHHNWYDHSDSRHPRVRFYNAHVYNNYYDGNAKYGAGSTMGSSVFMQNNYFRNCKDPMLTSMQGTDVYSTGSTRSPGTLGTFSSEDGGIIKACGNVLLGTYSFIPYGATDIVTAGTSVTASSRGIITTTDFDAYVVTDPATKVPSTITSYQGANYYSNFDTNGTSLTMYSWTPDTAENAKTKAMAYAGRVEGGDLKWTFDNSVEDTNSLVVTALKSAVTAYTGSLVSVQGETATPSPSASASAGASATSSATTGPIAITFDSFTSGATVNGVTITGNLKSGATAKTYNGITYTTAIKMESATAISFTLSTSATLTLITDTAAKKIKIDGTSYTTDADGVVTQSLASGSHTVVKGDSMNLYAIIITPAP
jgi:pectate lyase